MGIVKQMQIEEAHECYYECSWCGDGIPCDKDTYEWLVEQGRCDYCEHVWTKDD